MFSIFLFVCFIFCICLIYLFCICLVYLLYLSWYIFVFVWYIFCICLIYIFLYLSAISSGCVWYLFCICLPYLSDKSLCVCLFAIPFLYLSHVSFVFVWYETNTNQLCWAMNSINEQNDHSNQFGTISSGIIRVRRSIFVEMSQIDLRSTAREFGRIFCLAPMQKLEKSGILGNT